MTKTTDPLTMTTDAPPDSMTDAEKFFYVNAGWSYNRATETAQEGRENCARSLASAEEYAKEHYWQGGYEYSGETFGQQGDCFDVLLHPQEFDGEKFDGFNVFLRNRHDDTIGSLGGCTFKDNNPDADPYLRVIYAELALEAMPEENWTLPFGGREFHYRESINGFPVIASFDSPRDPGGRIVLVDRGEDGYATAFHRQGQLDWATGHYITDFAAARADFFARATQEGDPRRYGESTHLDKSPNGDGFGEYCH